ncbi:MAG TPA: GYD domain-containing protein [Candidatus Acidoferrales bacterium]|nr:GYD domain-containing protein [Candidatus Acidoferrales bacterium]
MAKFLVEASYTAEGARGLLKDGGTGRRAAVEELVKPLGGKVEAMYFAFGKHDVVLLMDAPDNATAVAVALAVNASGAVQLRTTVLLTPEEVDQAARKTVKYRAPGAGTGGKR